MKKLFFSILLLSLALSLFSCSKKDDTALFRDNFDYVIASPWDLTSSVNGWSNIGTSVSSWNISSGGESGNALQYEGTAKAQLVNSYTNSDYKISVQFRPANIVDADQRPFGLIGRIQATNGCYWVYVYTNDADNYVYLVIATYDGSSSSPIKYTTVSSGSPLDTSTWYTLTMTLDGTTITGEISGGGLDTTVTATDSTYTSGQVGILVWNGTVADYNVYFDNYAVTTISAD